MICCVIWLQKKKFIYILLDPYSHLVLWTMKWVQYGIQYNCWRVIGHKMEDYHQASNIHHTKSQNLIHGGQVMHICVSKIVIIDVDNGLSLASAKPLSAGILLIGPLRINASKILIVSNIFWFKKMLFNVSSAKLHLLCLSLNELNISHLILQLALPTPLKPSIMSRMEM